MHIYYFDGTRIKDFKGKNFGDELNPWLWPQFFPDILNVCNNLTFVGIGTLLNDRLPKDRKKIIFGSGAGYGNTPHIDHTYKIYFVRGKLTAKVLGVDPNLAITDPAILIRKIFVASGNKRFKKSYMPHYMEAIINGNGWRKICEDLNIHYIDPTASLQKVLAEISETEILFTEAMHGAIVADALRTPWVAIKSHPRILQFKWNDWLSSIEIPYQPFIVRRKSSIINKKSFFKYIDYQFIRLQMAMAIEISKPYLSSESKITELEERVMKQVETLKNDVLQNCIFYS